MLYVFLTQPELPLQKTRVQAPDLGNLHVDLDEVVCTFTHLLHLRIAMCACVWQIVCQHNIKQHARIDQSPP